MDRKVLDLEEVGRQLEGGVGGGDEMGGEGGGTMGDRVTSEGKGKEKEKRGREFGALLEGLRGLEE